MTQDDSILLAPVVIRQLLMRSAAALLTVAAALREVPTHGWSTAAVSAGAVACGLSPAAHGLAPSGPIELVRYFSQRCDLQMLAHLHSQQEAMRPLEVQNRLVLAMQTRLRMIEPYVHSWPQALALRALPSNLAESLADAHALTGLFLDLCGEEVRAPVSPVADEKIKRLALP